MKMSNTYSRQQLADIYQLECMKDGGLINWPGNTGLVS